MQSFAWIGFVAFFVASLTCGIRLLALWRRNGELPELLIGIGVLGIGPVGFGFITIAQLLEADHGSVARIVCALGILASSAGAFSKYLFNYTVYHHGNRRLRAVVWLAGAAFLACFVASWLENGFSTIGRIEASYSARTALQVGCLLWGSVEALRYWRMMGRRIRLGLADPVVANRFLLWGIGAGAAGFGTAVGFTAQLIIGRPPLEIPWIMLSSSMHGLVAAVAMWLAFLPPASYRRFVAQRGVRQQS
jgi:hypothetical protein